MTATSKMALQPCPLLLPTPIPQCPQIFPVSELYWVPLTSCVIAVSIEDSAHDPRQAQTGNYALREKKVQISWGHLT